MHCRACLKDVPDNLIFHLKRFDFNLRTMQRSKINDYFSFPHRIDMRPYKVEHIMESPDETPEDIFELVGILVHAGTAESGHYYSYIRERPSYGGQSANWVEFNDDNVNSFDPSCIEASCFGGPDYRTVESGNYQYEKSWSAYMLFYERSSVLQTKQRELKTTDSHPVRLPIHRQLSNYIAEENEMLIRKYCLYDEGHAPFVLRMLDNDQHITKGRCSQEHAIEKTALFTVLHHLDQVVVRTKDLPDFASYILALRQRLEACSDCSSDFLEWLISHYESLRQMLFRNPDQLVRSEIASAVVLALSKVKQDASPGIYGLYDSCMDDGEGSDISEANPRLFTKILTILSRFWETFHLHTRAWPEYFGLLVSIAHLGNLETAALLDCGFLRRVLEAIVADHALNPTVQMARMLSIISKRPVTKPVSFENMIALLEVLLKACDLQIDPVDDATSRLGALLDEQPMPLTLSEHYPIVRHWTRGTASILAEKLLFINQNERSTQEIIAILLKDGPELNHRTIMGAIRSGIQKTTATNTAAPFLRAALTYCEYATSHENISSMIKTVTNTTRSLDSTEGKEHLQFFKDLLELPHNNANVNRDNFFRYVIDQIPVWSPSLLTYYDSLVRTDTEDYLQQTILMRCITEPTPDMVEDAEENARAIMRVARNLGISCLKHLHEEYVRPRTQAVKANLLSIQGIIELCKPLYRDTDQDETDLKFQELYLSEFRSA
jgi:ubiquitin carboxyl-terminal hydrolase 34